MKFGVINKYKMKQIRKNNKKMLLLMIKRNKIKKKNKKMKDGETVKIAYMIAFIVHMGKRTI